MESESKSIVSKGGDSPRAEKTTDQEGANDATHNAAVKDATFNPEDKDSDTRSVDKDKDRKNMDEDMDSYSIYSESNKSMSENKSSVMVKPIPTDRVSLKSTSSRKTDVSKDDGIDTVSISSKSSLTSAVSSSPSLSSTNSIIPGVLCTPCHRANDKVGAVKYCVDCAENYCKPCLRKHIKANATRAHQLVGRDEMPDFTVAPPGGPLERGIEKCPRHKELDLDNFCEHHQVLCCDKCAYLEHGDCEHIIDLLTATREIDLKAEITNTRGQITELVNQLTVSRDQRYADQARTRQNTAQSLSVIREWRKEVNEFLDKLERQPIDVINTTCLEEDNQVNVDVRETGTVIELLRECSKKLNADTYSNINKFAILQKSKMAVKNAATLNGSLIKRVGRDTNIFVVNKMAVEHVKSLKSIGDFKSGGKILLEFQGYSNVSDKKDTRSPSSVNNTDTDPGCDKTWDIEGITQLADGRIIIADYENKQLGIFSNDFTFERKLHLGREVTDISAPFGVCETGENQLAVTVVRDKVVDIIDLEDADRDTPVHTEIGVGEYCRGVAYSYVYDELFVACGGGAYKDEGLGHVRVFDLQGNHLRSLKRSSNNGRLLLPQPINIAVSPNGETVYVTDRENGLVTMNRHGEQIACVDNTRIPEPRGICVGTTGNVLVTCQQSNSLVQVSMDGMNVNVVATGGSVLKRPKAICVDERKSRVIVSQEGTQELAVFNIN